MAVKAGYPILRARLYYRHVNQGEELRVADLAEQASRYRQVIPGDYTDSPYPLMYFFELHDGQGRAWFEPGLAADLSNQPYFVIRQTA